MGTPGSDGLNLVVENGNASKVPGTVYQEKGSTISEFLGPELFPKQKALPRTLNPEHEYNKP